MAREARLIKRLEEVNRSFPPRVTSAFIHFIWIGLGTRRRNQQMGRCVLCNGEHTWDSIEHYAHCPAVLRVATKTFGLRPPVTTYTSQSIKDRLEWLLLLDSGRPKDQMEKHFLFLYTTYRLQNCCRKEKVTIEDGGLIEKLETTYVL